MTGKVREKSGNFATEDL